MSNFSYNRRAPINVLIVAVNFNLVEVGGKRLGRSSQFDCFFFVHLSMLSGLALCVNSNKTPQS